MPINCQFNLLRSALVYYTGEQISGSLTLLVSKKAVSLEAINITLLGQSSTNWSERAILKQPQIEHNDSAHDAKPLRLNYTGHKVHIRETQKLAGALVLLPGNTQLGSFQFQLPHTLPATCQLPYGSINYTLQVELERRGKYVKCFKQRLIVRKCVEFRSLRPLQSTTPTLSLQLERSVFVPGQGVAYKLIPKRLHSHGYLNIRLCQGITYRSHTPEAKIKRVLRVLDESSEIDGALQLPLTAPIMSDTADQDLIEISYYLEALDDIESIRLPLCVGTVAPPMETDPLAHVDSQPLCFVNLATTALSQNELFAPFNQLMPHSCSREANAFGISRQCDRLKLLKHQKKQSYVKWALHYFYKNMLP
ncbi:uncharacterized protein LOC115624093 [Scaptodrosophila lebanonensis]|uniref:Uncharacterized protein LOC115624093 n=1 Tax=Drosophila lebanonensis TaxID=7225 RepID=A0A6J2THF9_DROLE|nr:uncharacterized protein LOC115624093 [Scaptodrosophila lebanonensis]